MCCSCLYYMACLCNSVFMLIFNFNKVVGLFFIVINLFYFHHSVADFQCNVFLSLYIYMHMCHNDGMPFRKLIFEYMEWNFEYIEWNSEYIEWTLNILNETWNILNETLNILNETLNILNETWLTSDFTEVPAAILSKVWILQRKVNDNESVRSESCRRNIKEWGHR